MNNNLVSIIVPIYNVEPYLNRCIESIVNQSYKNLEIILVDDGSPDNCPIICDEWAKKDKRIKVIHKINGGLSDARNVGMEAATGEYIAFVDSDDWIELNFIQMLAFELDNGADIAECATRLCDEKNNTLLIRGLNKNENMKNTYALNLLLNENGVYQTVWNKLYKKSVIKDFPFAKGKCHEDEFWTWKVILSSRNIHILNLPLYNYFQRDNSIMGTPYSLERLDSVEAAYECYKELSSNNNFSSVVSYKLIERCLYNLQCSLKYLNKSEKNKAKSNIILYLKKSKINITQIKALTDKRKYWYTLFLIFPTLTAKVRNFLNIGF